MLNKQSTLYIRKDLYDSLTKAVNSLSMCRSRLIEALLIKYSEKNKAGRKHLKMLKYQKIDKEMEAEQLCVFWRMEIYERCFDLKKSYKMSISYILAVAIEEYLDELMREIRSKGATYNYFQFYFIHTKNYHHTKINVTVWGDPGRKILRKVLKI